MFDMWFLWFSAFVDFLITIIQKSNCMYWYEAIGILFSLVSQITGNWTIKFRIADPLWEESTDDLKFPGTKGQ